MYQKEICTSKLFFQNEDRLSLFKNTFDITLVDDQSMDVVLSIIELIMSKR